MDKVTFETKLRFTCDGETIVTTYANLSLHQLPACHSRSRSSFAGNLASEPDRPPFLMNSELIEIAEYFRKMTRLAFPVATIKIRCYTNDNWHMLFLLKQLRANREPMGALRAVADVAIN